MESKFDKRIENFLKIILKNAQKIGLRVFFVGGIVRDNILNIKTSDIDVLVLGNAIEFAKNLPDEIKIASFHKDFCTVKVEYEDIQIDIASSRTESYPYSGGLPVLDSVGVSLEDDVLRRDFTVNSLYCELKLIDNEIIYELIDLVNGLVDIKNKILKVLHNKSYIDDPTRILRGLDFKYRFGFDFSKNDKKLICEYLNNINYENMSKDRVLKVLRKILKSDFQHDVFREIIENKYYKIIQKKSLELDFDKIYSINKGFNLNHSQICDFYLLLIEDNDIDKKNINSKLDLQKEFSKYDLSNLAYYYCKTNDSNVLEYFKIKDVKNIISGADLLNLGYKQGVELGNILNSLLDFKMNNPSILKSKQDELNWVILNFKIK